MTGLRNLILFIVCTPGFFLICSFKWPSEDGIVTEFSSPDSLLQPGVASPYLAISADKGFEYAADGQLFFQGQLANGLGNIQAVSAQQGLVQVYGNLGASDEQLRTARRTQWEDRREALIFFVLDSERRRVVNPELLLRSPAGNAAPTLRKLRFVPVSSPGGAGTVDYWSWYRRRSLGAGEYLLTIDWADGRNTWNDVQMAYSVRLLLNERLIYRSGAEYFYEEAGDLLLYPGHSQENGKILIFLKPGKNLIQVYLQDPKGLSNTYDFIVDG